MTINRRTFVGATILAATASTASAEELAPIVPLQRPASGHIRVAYLLDRFHNMMDLAGPMEAFGSAGSDEQHFEQYTVSPADEEFKLGSVNRARSDYLLSNAPQPHVVVMGAQGPMNGPSNNDAKSAWLRQVAPQADIVLSVCTGAFVLARSGLIDGKQTTTHHDYYEDFEREFPNVTLVRNRRFVDNGKFVSAGGLTSSIDGSLHVIARYYDVEEAQRVATYMEHYSDGWRTGLRTPT